MYKVNMSSSVKMDAHRVIYIEGIRWSLTFVMGMGFGASTIGLCPCDRHLLSPDPPCNERLLHIVSVSGYCSMICG